MKWSELLPGDAYDCKVDYYEGLRLVITSPCVEHHDDGISYIIWKYLSKEGIFEDMVSNDQDSDLINNQWTIIRLKP